MRLMPALFIVCLTVTALAAAEPAPTDAPPDGLHRYPTIGGGAVVFAAEGDLWRVPAEGGLAIRLTAHEGEEKFPRLSPDNRLVTFTAQYEGNDDVYVMPADGGEPKRLTYHPAPDQTIGWTPDGKILFRSERDHPHGDSRVYTLGPEGGVPSLIPLEPAAWISFEPRGRRLALQKMGLEFHNWKRYKGGEAEQIEVGTLEPLAFKEITDYDGKDAFPMWADDGRIYFVTDRWGRPNLASMLPDGSDVRRLTRFEDYDVRWPALGDGRIVYQHRMELWMYELASGRNERLAVRLPSDRLQVRERFVEPAKHLSFWSLSADGERIALETRGDLFVTRTRKKGLIRRLTEDSLNRTKFPVFSPDGRSIAAWSEIDGEEQLVILSSDSSAPRKTLESVPPGWHFPPAWSPDGKRIAWGDEKYQLWVADAATGRAEVVDRGHWEIGNYAWSPDGRYLAYTADLPEWIPQVRIWDASTGKVHPLTDPAFSAFSPAWDPKGRYLFFLSDRHVNPHLDPLEARFIVDEATLPFVVALRSDDTLPFAPRGDAPLADEVKEAAEAKDKEAKESKEGKQGKEKKGEAPAPIRIDFDGLAGRLVQVPVPPGNYFGLSAVEGRLHWVSRRNTGMRPPDAEDDDYGPLPADLVTYELEKEKLRTLASGVLSYRISANQKVLVYRTKEGFVRVEAGATESPKDEGLQEARIDLSGWSLSVDPRLEWRQMLREAWRLQRDFFYDAKMHGVDWEGVWKQYGPLAERIASRDDLDDLLGEMFGELNAGHAYKWGGDVRRGSQVGTGLLAADLEPDASTGFWRIRKIYRGDYPDPKVSSPLARADLRVKEGMWLVAIDGKRLTAGEDYLRRLANRAGREVELSISDGPRLEGARRIVVRPVADDTEIRYADWIRETRAYVDRVSGGKIGYIHLYDMGGRGLQQFARDYPPQWMRKGLIIDDRWNHGGFVAPMIVAHLDRKVFTIDGHRYGALRTTPARAFRGHMAVLINRQGGSDCETLAQEFKDFKLGPVIGTRTWGGWVGIRGKRLRDGGAVTQPEFGGWDPQGRAWVIEGHGVDPDVVLDLGPDGFINGKDVQLDYAVEDLMDRIARDPRDFPPAPPIPPRPLLPLKD